MAVFISVKQNLSYAWSLGPHTLVKLTLNGIFISVKQNLNYVWSFAPHTLVKLTLDGIYSFFLSIKQNLSYAWLLGSHTLGKLTFYDIFLFLTKCQNRSKIITNSYLFMKNISPFHSLQSLLLDSTFIVEGAIHSTNMG